MERKPLQELLEEGASLAQIARRVGLHEATVGYWVRRHGLAANDRAMHAAKGPLDRELLVRLVEGGRSLAKIAQEVGRSKTTVRYWLREYGLSTTYSVRRAASARDQTRLMSRCPKHGVAKFTKRPAGGYRCTKCSAEAVSRRRRKVKRLLVQEAGGACLLCGYSRCVSALEFHHVDPSEKHFALSLRAARSLERLRTEARKCVLLCANCHCEVEVGVATLPNVRALP